MEKIIATYHEQNVDGHDSNGNPSCIYFTNCYMTKYTYSATGQKLAVGHFVALPNVTWEFGVKPNTSNHTAIFAGHTDYLLGGSLIVQEGTTRMLLFDGGYAKAERTGSNSTNYGYTLFYYTQDHLGNNREVISASGALKQKTNYYPFGAIITDISSSQDFQPYKYNGKELDRMHGLDTYDYGARQYYSILGRWDRMDPLCEKYYSLSPYNYCGNNPVKWVDIRGDSISSTGIAQYGEAINVNILQSVISDWQTISGLTLFISNNGNIEYAKDDNGMPKVSVSQKDGETIENGSQAARNLLIKTINAKETVTFQGGRSSSNVSGTNMIGINFKQVSAFINGTSKGLDNRTMGWGMTLLHEILHTPINGNLKDDTSSEYSTGPVVDYMNKIREQMNNQGFNFGIRKQYMAIPYGNKSRICFSGGQYVEF